MDFKVEEFLKAQSSAKNSMTLDFGGLFLLIIFFILLYIYFLYFFWFIVLRIFCMFYINFSITPKKTINLLFFFNRKSHFYIHISVHLFAITQIALYQNSLISLYIHIIHLF